MRQKRSHVSPQSSDKIRDRGLCIRYGDLAIVYNIVKICSRKLSRARFLFFFVDSRDESHRYTPK